MSIVKNKKHLFYFLMALVLLRPSLDILSQWEFQIYKSLTLLSITDILGILISVFLLFYLLKNIKKIIKIPLFYPISVFLVLIFLSVFYSIEPFLSIKEIIRIFTIFSLYFFAYLVIKNKKEFWILIKFIILSYFIPALFALIQLAFGLGKLDQFGGFRRIYGTFAHPNPFAFYTFFILGLVLSITFIFLKDKINLDSFLEKQKMIKKENLFNKNFLIVFSILLTFLLFMTYTRSAILCLAIFIIVFGIFKYRKFLLIGTFLFVLAYIFSDVFQERIWELISLDPSGSVVWRFRLWRDIIPVYFWQPWFGYGLNTFTKITEYYRGFSWGSLEAHNDYLKIIIENGIIGLTAYLSIIFGSLFYLAKIIKNSVNNEKILALGFLTIFICIYLASSFDNILRETALQWNLWILLGAWLKLKTYK